MNNPAITFFDLDHTLIDADCEQAWVELLIAKGLAPASDRALQEEFIELHAMGRTPVAKYIAFMIDVFIGKSEQEMAVLATQNFEQYIRAKIYPDATEQIAEIQRTGGQAVLLSGSFRPVVNPIAAHLGFEDIVCTELELKNGAYTGQLASDFCVKEGKLKRAQEYCQVHGHALSDVGYFGDSLSDVPMLERVGYANVVNPRAELSKLALRNNWHVVDWMRA